MSQVRVQPVGGRGGGKGGPQSSAGALPSFKDSAHGPPARSYRSSREGRGPLAGPHPLQPTFLSPAGANGHCSGHGTFSPETCGCRCEQGWEGAACERPACPGACSGHGRCVDGRCECDAPYVGADCAYPACPENCSGHGVCVRGACRCHEDFTSEDCSERRCPGDCSGHGFCDTGECYCEEGFSGPDCAQGESADARLSPFPAGGGHPQTLLHLVLVEGGWGDSTSSPRTPEPPEGLLNTDCWLGLRV